MELGFALSSEDHPPNELVRQALLAEQAGFTFALISDHFHPWIDDQGHSPFVWSTLGGIAQATETIRVGTGVTCPLIRIHPAIVAQAAATVAAMMPGRFFLGVGTGENLNEHVTGARWPLARRAARDARGGGRGHAPALERRRATHRGKHYTVEQARLYTLPDEPPELFVAAVAAAGGASSPAGSATASSRPRRTQELVADVRGGRRRGQAEDRDDARRL